MQKSRSSVSDIREKGPDALRILTSDSCLLSLHSSLVTVLLCLIPLSPFPVTPRPWSPAGDIGPLPPS
jgi:hypothetical protein